MFVLQWASRNEHKLAHLLRKLDQSGYDSALFLVGLFLRRFLWSFSSWAFLWKFSWSYKGIGLSCLFVMFLVFFCVTLKHFVTNYIIVYVKYLLCITTFGGINFNYVSCDQKKWNANCQIIWYVYVSIYTVLVTHIYIFNFY